MVYNYTINVLQAKLIYIGCCSDKIQYKCTVTDREAQSATKGKPRGRGITVLLITSDATLCTSTTCLMLHMHELQLMLSAAPALTWFKYAI